ncbi:hypothetical protein LAZ67_1007178 [Cordylochernes scorpioides]|uniref:Uncharacterized protein n=1 Tax=Cordylochernes scorpioides TaxID=51811 RepID=A0ABY6JZ52_9ARAC|nr:hypothetical protein LAZ67_1007178 [Cordylochernes scorpioides]
MDSGFLDQSLGRSLYAKVGRLQESWAIEAIFLQKKVPNEGIDPGRGCRSLLKIIFSDDDSVRREQQSDDTNFEAGVSSEPHLLTQGDLNDLIFEFGMKSYTRKAIRVNWAKLLLTNVMGIEPYWTWASAVHVVQAMIIMVVRSRRQLLLLLKIIFSDDDSVRREQQSDDTNFEAGASSEPHLVTQGDLNDLVRDLDLSKKQSALLGSRLKGWNLLHKGTKVCFYRKCQDEFQDFFSQENDLVYCNGAVSLMEGLGHDHDIEQWRLFVDSSKISLKAVLLHNGNKFPSVPIAHTSNMKETYENMKLLLKKIEYERYGWKICSDWKVIALLRGLQLGYTRFCCFLYEWDSRDRKRHYIKKGWSNREIFTPGHNNIVNPPLIDSENIYLPALHIKLGLMKTFVKAMDRNASGFAYLKQKYSSISDAKIKESIFVGPQIREFLQDGNFQNSLNEVEAAAWNSFRNVCKNFLGSVKAENYRDMICYFPTRH